MTIRFDDRVAVITGAGRGLGKAHALALAERGAKLVINDLGGARDGSGASSQAAQSVVNEIEARGGTAIADAHNIATPDGAQALMEAARARFGRVDILINNAGILRDKTFRKMPLEDFEQVIQVHLMGSVYCCKAALEPMIENNYGRILFTTSASGLYGNFGQTNYSAAKLGLVGFMNALRLEVAKHNIFVNALAPIAGTRMMEDITPSDVMEKIDPALASAAALYLCSQNCSLTGQIIEAGGGFFAAAQIIGAAGVVLAPDKTDVDSLALALEKITDMSGAKTFTNTAERIQHALAKTAQA